MKSIKRSKTRIHSLTRQRRMLRLHIRYDLMEIARFIPVLLCKMIFIALVTSVSQSKTEPQIGIHRRSLRCAMAHIPPFDLLTIFPNGSFNFVGSSRTIAEWMAVKLNFSLVLVHPPQEEVKERGNEATLDMVATGKADFSASGYAITPARYARLEPATYPNWEEGYRMVVPRPGEQDRLLAFMKPFDENVWLMLGASFVVVSLFMGFITWLSARQSSNVTSGGTREGTDSYLGKYFLYNVNVLTNHGDYLSESKMSFLIGVGSWLLAASVLVYGYSSIVVSSITLPNQMPTVNSLEDVVTHTDISLIVRTDTYIGSLVNTSTDVPLYKALREKAMKRPESIGNEGVINSTKLLLTGKYAYPFVETAVRFIVATQYAREKKCRFKLSKRLSLSNSYFYNCLEKGNKALSRELSIATMQLAETGLVRQWVKTLPWIPKADKCFADVSKTSTAKQQQSSIKLVDLGSAFFILGVGIACSTFAFLAELIISFQNKKRSSA